MTLGADLRKSRKDAGLSLREAARRIQISPSFLSDIELGRRFPGPVTALSIKNLYGLTALPQRPTCFACGRPL